MLLAILLLLLGLALRHVPGYVLAQSGGDFDLAWSTIDTGGGMPSTGGAFSLLGTAGQPDAGVLNGGVFSLEAGFWNRDAGPTAVVIGSFAATVAPPGVVLSWETLSEHGCLGFNLYRSDTPQQLGERLNDALIPSRSPGGGQGARYSFLDGTASAGVTFYYTLEHIEVTGGQSPHGPVRVTPRWQYLPLIWRGG